MPIFRKGSRKVYLLLKLMVLGLLFLLILPITKLFDTFRSGPAKQDSSGSLENRAKRSWRSTVGGLELQNVYVKEVQAYIPT